MMGKNRWLIRKMMLLRLSSKAKEGRRLQQRRQNEFLIKIAILI